MVVMFKVVLLIHHDLLPTALGLGVHSASYKSVFLWHAGTSASSLKPRNRQPPKAIEIVPMNSGGPPIPQTKLKYQLDIRISANPTQISFLRCLLALLAADVAPHPAQLQRNTTTGRGEASGF